MLLSRIKYLFAKTRRAWSDGTLWEKARRFLRTSIRIPGEMTAAYVRQPKVYRHLDIAGGFADHRSKPAHHRSNPEHLRRIIAAYKASKQAQKQADGAFAIRGLWTEWIDINYRELIAALQNEDESRLAALLENLHREQFTIGAGSSFDAYVRYRTSLTGRYYVRVVWSRYRRLYHTLASPAEAVDYPLVGNPVGIPVKHQVIPIHTFRYAYHALEMRHWLRDVPNAVVAEIGSGVGEQAYQLMRRTDTTVSKYVMFDIPEVASVCSYFLLSAFPDKRIRLFGEGPVSTEPCEDYDLAVFPHFESIRLADRSIDLFHNACSFSEMDSRSATAYLGIIERASRRYFSHINHDVRLRYQTRSSTNVLGSELVPDPTRFKLVFKKPRLFCLPEDRPLPAYEYLYEKIETS